MLGWDNTDKWQFTGLAPVSRWPETGALDEFDFDVKVVVDLALTVGSIAGWAATDRTDIAIKSFAERRHW